MASNIDISLDDIAQQTRFTNQRKFNRGLVGGAASKFRTSVEKPSDLRSVLAKKQTANISDLRSKLKPKALYTNKRAKPPPPAIAAAASINGGTEERKKLKLTTTFKNSISAVAGPGASEEKKSHSRSRKTESAPVSQRRPSSSTSRLPSYEEAKKISVTVPGSSKPMSEYSSSHRREERLAAQIMRSKEMRQDGYMKGREEFLASTITSAVGGVGGGLSSGGGSRGVSLHVPRVQRGRSPSPVADYRPSYDPLVSSSAVPSFSSGSRQRGITTSTSMFISNLSDTVSKNDVAELCSVVGALDSVYMHAPGIAEVVFKYKDDALEAYKKYNQRNLDGQPMHCKLQPASRSRVSTVVPYGHSYMDDYFPHGAHNSGFY